METKVFVLKNKKTYRRFVKIYVPRGLKEGFISKYVMFTTEALVNTKERNKNSRLFNAEYHTSNAAEIEALMTSDGYGVDYVLKDDYDGKMKQAKKTLLSNDDHRKASLIQLFEQVGLPFDNSKNFDVLFAEYQGFIKAQIGLNLTKGVPKAMQIPAQKVNVSEDIEAAKDMARAKYFDRYGESVPVEFWNDVALLDGMSNPNFDAKSYIEIQSKAIEETAEALVVKYQEKFGKLPPNAYKNNAEWLKAKLAGE